MRTGGGGIGSAMRRHPWWWLLGLWVVFSVGGELLALWGLRQQAPAAAEEGEVIDAAVRLLTIYTIPVFVIVTLVLVFSVTIFRRKPDEDGDAEVQVRSDRRAALGWLGVTGGLAVLVTVYPGVTGLQRLFGSQRAQSDTLDVDVVAQQWAWFFSYPAYGVSYADELVLPVNRPVRFRLRTRDVIHSFWVPAFRIKQDMLPGERRSLYLTPSRRTSTAVDPMARVQCAELCGIGHPQMSARVRVVTAEEFTGWAGQQRRKPPTMDQMEQARLDRKGA